MKLENTIKRMILRHPFILPNRLRVLDQLYCVIGTGMEWRGGQIVYKPGHWERISLAAQRQKSIDSAVQICLSMQKVLGKTSRQREERKVIEREKKIFAYTDKHIKSLCQNRDFYWVAPWDKMTQKIYGGLFHFYPLCEYSALLRIPDDVKPDWLAGAIEVCELIEAVPLPEQPEPRLCAVRNKEIVQDLLPKLKERWNEKVKGNAKTSDE